MSLHIPIKHVHMSMHVSIHVSIELSLLFLAACRFVPPSGTELSGVSSGPEATFKESYPVVRCLAVAD